MRVPRVLVLGADGPKAAAGCSGRMALLVEAEAGANAALVSGGAVVLEGEALRCSAVARMVAIAD